MTPADRPPTILRSDELRQLRQAESILREAESTSRDTRSG